MLLKLINRKVLKAIKKNFQIMRLIIICISSNYNELINCNIFNTNYSFQRKVLKAFVSSFFQSQLF